MSPHGLLRLLRYASTVNALRRGRGRGGRRANHLVLARVAGRAARRLVR